MSVRAVCTGGGDGATGPSTTVVLTFPGSAAAGDVMIAVTMQNSGVSTCTTPTGWTLISGPDNTAAANGRSYMFGKTLDAADITAGSLTITWNTSNRTTASGTVITAGNLAGRILGTVLNSTSATPTMPSVTTVTANSDVLEFIADRVASGAPPTMTTWNTGFVSGQTARSNTAGINSGVIGGYLSSPGAAGSYGGSTVTLSTTSNSVEYIVAIPPIVSQSGDVAVTATATVATASRKTALTDSAVSTTAAVTTGASGYRPTTAALTTTAGVTTDAFVDRAAAAPVTVTAAVTAAALLTRGVDGVVSVTAAVTTAARGVRAAVVDLTATVAVTTGSFLTRAAAVAVSTTATIATDATVTAGGSVKVWNGSSWALKPIKVWNGSAWVIKPLKVYIGGAWVPK